MKKPILLQEMAALLARAPTRLRVVHGKRVYRYTKCPLPECTVWHWYGSTSGQSAGTMERPRVAMYCSRDHAIENRRRLNNARQRRWQQEFKRRHGMSYMTAMQRGLTGQALV